MIVLLVSALKRKMLFAFRLCLLVVILAVLVNQIYMVFIASAPPPPTGSVTSVSPKEHGFPTDLLDWLKDYYRGNLR